MYKERRRTPTEFRTFFSVLAPYLYGTSALHYVYVLVDGDKKKTKTPRGQPPEDGWRSRSEAKRSAARLVAVVCGGCWFFSYVFSKFVFRTASNTYSKYLLLPVLTSRIFLVLPETLY